MRLANSTALLLPGFVALLLVAGLTSTTGGWYIAAIVVGCVELLLVSVENMRHGDTSLDYIALLAMAVALYTHEYLAGAVIAFMYTSGEALEAYASRRARASLSALLNRIPKVALVRNGETLSETPLGAVAPESIIVVRTGELVPLDGTLVSDRAVLNLANLTGESLPETLAAGAVIKSGSVNASEAFDMRVSGTLETSTYAKIVDLVQNARTHEIPFVRLTTRANLPFTLLTLLIAGVTYLFTHDVTRVLAVLVVATPCPLIIAAPVAFIGGLSRAAGRTIIIKTPSSLERLTRVKTIFFDKTGTLTIGKPALTQTVVLTPLLSEMQVLTEAASLGYHSIHPLSRALVATARERGITATPATDVHEEVGVGLSGRFDNRRISLSQASTAQHKAGGISLVLTRDGSAVALFHFNDVLKDDVQELLEGLRREEVALTLLTGDRAEHAATLFEHMPLTIRGDCTPEDKYHLVDKARTAGAVVAMVGDGLNDAPALARADIGIVFSGTENSASIEAADIAILGHDVRLIRELFDIAKRSMQIARQSVFVGIALSTTAMVCASLGLITPVAGALLQETIDVAVILNALRAAFTPRV